MTRHRGPGRRERRRQSPKPRYSREEFAAMRTELEAVRKPLEARLTDLRRAYATTAHHADGYPLMVRLRMAVRKIDEALEEAEKLMYNDYPKG